ncbi:MAG: cytochrome c3 family protein [Candidatus Zixiibacteriota bacterium]|nr:MAG: cytochrome c3 family protein [candidate division Zixibacteria bacterium]
MPADAYINKGYEVYRDFCLTGPGKKYKLMITYHMTTIWRANSITMAAFPRKTGLVWDFSSLMKFILLPVFLFAGANLCAQSAEDCLICHEDPDLTKERDGREVSLFIDPDRFNKSIHIDLECVGCHFDLMDVELPHDENLEPVDCGMCHDQIADVYTQSLHGEAVRTGEKLAPRCRDCHGAHDILAVTSPESRVARFKIPFMCGYCHKEGSAVTQTYDIPQDSILSHYSQSIHGFGLFKQGLTVTAVCTDCHTAHSVLPHSDPRSSIHRDNVAAMCQGCHGRIEEVHQKVIRGELWEKEPHKVPACVDCHAPHEIRRVFYEEGMADRDCMQCHEKRNLTAVRDGKIVSMYVDTVEVHNSIHRQTSCAQCHTGATRSRDRPCATVADRVDCSICHSEVVETYASSIHGRFADRGDQRAPGCTDCHGTHEVRGSRDPDSPTFPTAVPDLCARCHGEEGIVSSGMTEGELDPVSSYLAGIHGIGLKKSGLVVTAKCTDCHTTHHLLPKDDPESSVNHNNLTLTCAKCHKGIYESFSKSIHSPTVADTDQYLPTCNGCHESHAIVRTDSEGFRIEIMDQCGNCHRDVAESYFETFHGKVSKLGYAAAAKCYDCHGAHNILPMENQASTLSRQHIVATCGACHEGSHRQFAGYLTHATHHDRSKYPILFYTFWFMTFLLVGTLAVAGTHTVLWLPRSFQMMKEHKKKRAARTGRLEYRRFTTLHSRLHILVIISFLGLATTGMTLKFSYLGWAQWLSGVFGGFESAGYIHRICAIITFFYFGTHIINLVRMKCKQRLTWRQLLFKQESMLPKRSDWHEFIGTLKWFIGAGPRPRYGRWTYWEKFDYFAVFWGVVVIGATGLMLWFPEFFTRFLPGWIINVATIIHSDEALLAVAFIFTVHFFNTHFRPDKFPMDIVIFTGRVPLEELKEDRPREYEALLKSREIKKHLVEPLPPVVVRGMRIFGAIALFIGISLILLIVWAEIFGYR